MSRSDLQRIEDIVNSCRRLREIASAGRDEFFASEVLQDAACYRLTVIGEALDNLSEDFTVQHPGLEIPQARGMRNRLTHEYYDIDVEVLWNTLAADIVELEHTLGHIVDTSMRARRSEPGTIERRPRGGRDSLGLF